MFPLTYGITDWFNCQTISFKYLVLTNRLLFPMSPKFPMLATPLKVFIFRRKHKLKRKVQDRTKRAGRRDVSRLVQCGGGRRARAGRGACSQQDDASLYSEPSMVKKSSSFHCRVSKVGRFIASLCQHSSMISQSVAGHPGGLGMRYPCSTWCSTSAFVIPVILTTQCEKRNHLAIKYEPRKLIPFRGNL